MAIQNIISNIVQNMDANTDSFDFTFETDSWKNLNLDEQPLPSVHLMMPLRGKPKMQKAGSFDYEYACILSFMYASELDDTPEAHALNLAKSENALSQFMLMLQKDTDNVNTSETVFGEFLHFTAHRMYDRCVDGVTIEIKITPKQRPAACVPSYSVPVGDCDPVLIKNSDESYSVYEVSGGTRILPDISFTDSDGIVTQIPAVTDIVATPAVPCVDGAVTLNSAPLVIVPNGLTVDVELVDQNGDTITPTSIVGGVIEVSRIKGASSMSLKTGQTFSYATGDDGDEQRGRPRKTLPILSGAQQLNFFGSKWAWTGLTGGYFDYDTNQYKDVNGTVTTRSLAFPDYVIVDHRTESGSGDIMFFSLSSSWMGVSSLDFTTAQTTADALTVAGFSDWFVLNINELKDTFWSVDTSLMPPLENTYPNTPSPWVLASNTTDTTNSSQIFTFWIAGVSYGTELLYPKTATNPVVAYIFGRIGNISDL